MQDLLTSGHRVNVRFTTPPQSHWYYNATGFRLDPVNRLAEDFYSSISDGFRSSGVSLARQNVYFEFAFVSPQQPGGRSGATYPCIQLIEQHDAPATFPADFLNSIAKYSVYALAESFHTLQIFWMAFVRSWVPLLWPVRSVDFIVFSFVEATFFWKGSLYATL
jgi:hypothetical protein